MIKEIIVVEGRDDIAAVKRAVEAELILTQGFSLSQEVMTRIKLAQERKGVIIFTDPDSAGQWIRKKIKAEVAKCKDAYLTKAQGSKNNDIGIENASPQAIKAALKKAGASYIKANNTFKRSDLIKAGLLYSPNAKKSRANLGKKLKIGYANSKQLLNRLNNYGIKRKEFFQAVEEIIRY